MPAAYHLPLCAEQVEELTDAARHAPKPFIRERASAILKVHGGRSIRQVALHGCLRPHTAHTVKRWINRYLAEGLAGLEIAAGRGRHRRFSPSEPDGGRGGA